MSAVVQHVYENVARVAAPVRASVGACELHATVDVTTVAASTATPLRRGAFIVNWLSSIASYFDLKNSVAGDGLVTGVQSSAERSMPSPD
jgi:hypothetical protein